MPTLHQYLTQLAVVETTPGGPPVEATVAAEFKQQCNRSAAVKSTSGHGAAAGHRP